MAHNAWEADKMLDSYIYDYLLKRNLQNTAKAFQGEARVSSEPVSIDAPGGFLLEWWSVFWEIFIARTTNDKHSDVAASYLESIKAQKKQQSSQHQIQMQQLLLQKRVQQQQQEHYNVQQQRHDDNGQFSTSDQDILLAADSPARQNSVPANSLSAKIYEERTKVPAQMDALDEGVMKRMFTENSGQLPDSNPTSMLKSALVSTQASGQIFDGSVSGISGSLQHAQARNQRLQESTQDIKAEANAALNLRTVGDGSLFGVGVLGTNQAGNNLTLKGWPLTGLDHLRSGFLQHKSLMQSPQPLHHLQFLTPQQQQILLQAQQSMASSPVDMDNRRLRMLYGSRNLVPGRDIQSNSFTETIPSGGPSLQNIGSSMQLTESDMLIKKIAALQQHQQSNNQQQLLHHPLLSPQLQISTHHTNEQEKMTAGISTMHGSLSNSFHGNEQVFKNQSRRKRRRPITPSVPADSSGTANTAGPSPSSSPSTPSAHSPGDTVSTPSLHHNTTLSKALVVYGAEAPGSIGSSSSQLGHFVNDDCLKDNLFLPHDELDAINAGSHYVDSDKGSILQEISSARASTGGVLCCHFSSDGKLLATGGHDKKVVLWNAETLKQKSTLEEHTSLISDVRFSPNIPRFATSSFDTTIRLWDKQDYSVRTFTGHLAPVMSLDFHPVKDDLICSCDGNNEMRFWSINDGRTVQIAQGGSTQLRFQPRLGGYLAAASDNVVSILDVETQVCMRRFEGHAKRVDSLCWDPSSEYVVSVSEDTVKVWSLKMGNEEHAVQELKCTGSKFSSCAFHPTYSSLLIIGCFQSLELWDMSENRTMTIPAHDGLVTSLATSSTGMVASTGHDKYVKLWGSPLPTSARFSH